MYSSIFTAVTSISVIVLAQSTFTTVPCGQACIDAGYSSTCDNCDLNGLQTCTNVQCMCTSNAWVNQFISCVKSNCSTSDGTEALLDYARTCVADAISTTPIAPTILATTSTTSTSSPSPTSSITSLTSTTSIAHYSSTTKTTGSSFSIIPSPAPTIQRAGLSAGAKAGISISVIAVIVAFALGIVVFLKRQKRSQSAPDATLKFESSYPDAIQSDPAPVEKLFTAGQSLQELRVDRKEMARGINAAGNEKDTTSSLHQQGHLAQDASTQPPMALSELPAQHLPQSSVQRRKPLAELQAQTFQPPHVAEH